MIGRKLRTAVMACFVGAAFFAHGGDIVSIDVMQGYPYSLLNGGRTYPNPDSPHTIKETITIRVRLLNADYGGSQQYEWQALSIGSTSYMAPQLGLVIGGVPRWADLVDCKPTTNTTYDAGLRSNLYFTDLFFEYTVQAGDIAEPVSLMNLNYEAASGTPGETYFVRNPNIYNRVETAADVRRIPVFSFVADDVLADVATHYPAENPPDEIGVPRSAPQNVYIRTIDFEEHYDDATTAGTEDDPYVWRTIAQNSTDAVGKYTDITIEVAGKASYGSSDDYATMWIWTGDDSILSPVGKTEIVDGKIALPILISTGDKSKPFTLRAKGTEGQGAWVYMSSAKTNVYSATSGTQLNTSVKRYVKIGPQKKPSIELKFGDTTWTTATANGEYNKETTYPKQMAVSLSEAFTNTVKVVIKPFVNGKDVFATYTNHLVAVAAQKGSANGWRAMETELEFAAGEKEKYLYIYPLGATKETIADAYGVEFKITSVTGEDAADFYKPADRRDATLYIEPEQPQISGVTFDPPTAGVELQNIEIEIDDSCRNMRYLDDVAFDGALGSGTNLYAVTWERGLGGKGSKLPTVYVAPTNGVLSISGVTYPRSGTFTATVKVTNPDGLSSEITVPVTVSDPDKIVVSNNYNDWGYVYNEGETVELSVGISVENSNPLYAFVEPLNEDATNALVAARNKQVIGEGVTYATGVEIPAGTKGPVKLNLVLQDGPGTIAFRVVLCETQTYDATELDNSYASDNCSIICANVAPQAAPGSKAMRVGAYTVTNNAALPSAIPADNAVSLRFTFSDVAADRRLPVQPNESLIDWINGADPDEFTNGLLIAKWSFYNPNGMLVDTRITVGSTRSGVDSCYVSTNFTFTAIGDNEVAVQLLDKDMIAELLDIGIERQDIVSWLGGVPYGDPAGYWESALSEDDWGPEFRVIVPVAEKAFVSVTPVNATVDADGNLGFNEGQTSAQFDVVLSTPAEQALTVRLWLERTSRTEGVGANDIGKLGSLEIKGKELGLSTNEYVDVQIGRMADRPTQPPRITGMDGTPYSQYTLHAVVITETKNSNNIPMKDFYSEGACDFSVFNRSPKLNSIKANVGIAFDSVAGLASTNVVTVTQNQDITIEWNVADFIRMDETNDFAVSWSSSEPGSTMTTNNVVSGTYKTKFSTAGDKTISLSVNDKDGGSCYYEWHFNVEASKRLYTLPLMPYDPLSDIVAAAYGAADGLGSGKVTADGSDGSSLNGDIWDYAVEKNTAVISALGDEGSYVYAFISELPGENSVFTPELMKNDPQIGTNAVNQLVSLPLAEQDAVAYPDRYVEVVFSREFLEADNVGDINQDGIPDIFAKKLLVAMGGSPTIALGDDMATLTTYNHVDEYLPGVWQVKGEVTLKENAGASYAPIGHAFTAFRKIRGFHEGLNYIDEKRGTLTVISDPDFGEDEQKAWEKYAADNGLDPAARDLLVWSPEPRGDYIRMNPTVADTDGDDFPDSWEYFFWYQAQVWVPAVENGADVGLGKPRKGQKLVFERFNSADILVGTEITAAEVLERFNPCTPLDTSVDGFNPDFDRDGLSDYEELLIGTNPCHWDTDGDKMCDGWEVMNSLDPLAGAKHGNPDGDFMAILSLEGHISIEDGIDVDGNTRYVFDVYDQLQYGVDYDFDLAAGGLALIRDVTITVIGGGEKLNPDGTPYTYGLTFAEEIEIYDGNLPIPFHWGSPMLKHIEPLNQVTYPAGTPVAFRDFVIVHDQVRRAFGFDPRTAWNCDANGYVADRWNPAINGELSPNDTTGVAMYTEPYCDYDEYLIMRYRHDYQNETDANGIPVDEYGRNIAPVYPDNAEWKEDDIWATINGYTTSPNVTYAKTDIEAILNPTNETAYSEGEAANLVAAANIAEYLAEAFAQAGSNKRARIGHGADTDGDGAPDGWEIYVGRNPNAAPSAKSDEGLQAPWDFDEDYLGFVAEYAGTDSCNAYRNCDSIYSHHPGLHSAGEGFQQGWFNKFFPTDPNEPDTDGDGIVDGGEGMAWLGTWANGGNTYLVAGTAAGMTFIYGNPEDSVTCCVRGGGMNPCTVDTDIDGLPDPWEMTYAGIVVDISTRQYAGPAPNFNPEIAEATFISDGLNAPDYAIPDNPVYICGGMDATWNGDSWTDPIQGGHSTDARLGTRRDVDFDHDGLQNYQEYLVQQVRHFRYDDITTPLMGRYLDEGLYDPMNPTGPLLAPHELHVATAFTPMMQDADDFSVTALMNWGGAVDQDFSIVSNFVGNTVVTNEFTGVVTEIPNYEVVTNITGGGVVANKRTGTGYNYMFSTPWVEAGWRNNGYMASPTRYWDRMITCDLIQPSIMMPPAGAYVSTDPRIADTDGDGMDDFYEMFHGLNPLLGSTVAGAKDIIATAWGQPNYFNAFWNEWTHNTDKGRQDFNRIAALQGMPGSDDPPIQDITALDPLLYPWAMGAGEADPDGDGLRNDSERVTANLTSPITTHTDPTPLWYTDSSSGNSYVTQYYQNTAPVNAMPFWPIMIGFDDPYSAQTPDGGYGGFQFLYSFEENEGYDTDNDWKSDGREIVRTFRAPTDPLNFTDPARRQALYLDGDKSWVQSRATFMRDIFMGTVPSKTTVDFFKQFTVEAWIRPEKIGEQTIIDRCSLYGYDAINKDNAAIRTNFRLGITNEGKLYGMFDNDDARVSVRADSESCQTVIGQVVPTNEWTHVALSYNGKRLVLYVNGTEQANAPTHLIPANGVTVIAQDPTYTNTFTQTAYEAVPGALFIGGRPETAANGGGNAFDTATITYDSMKNDEWFKGYIDEVRIWDGARTETEIAQWYNRHMTMDDAATNRLEVYTHLMGPEADSSRNDNDGLKDLTAELVQLYDFSDMPGALSSADVAQNASGFDNAVRGQLVSTGGISGEFTENVGWWDSCQTKSTAYGDYAIVPWVKNTVHHLPIMDGSVVDSFLYSDYLGGYTTPASRHDLQRYALNNSAMPYPFYNYFLERYQRLFKLNQIAATDPENETLEDLVCRYEYEIRSDFIGTADLVPMGGAYSKPCPEMWDGQGSSDLWELTKTDSDGDGIPDWWETENDLDPNDPSDWAKTITWKGAAMPAWEAYLRDLARGMMPDGNADPVYASTSDIDGDGLLDWWQNIYALEQGATGDDDGDGLSNYVEYMLSEVFTLKSAGEGDGKWIRFAPDNAYSVSLNVSDYFYRLNKLYIGEIFTDHDRIKDQWEAKHLIENDSVSPYAYDADIDADADGWSNEAEFQSGTKPTVLASLTVDAVQLNEYPVPTIELTISYHGTQNIGDKPVVVQAWSDQTLATIPDAVWTLGGQGDVQLYENGASNVVTGVKHFGMNPLREMLLHLSPGSVVPGSIEFEFKDLGWILYNMLTDQGYTMDPALAIWEGSIIDQPRNDDLEIGDIVRQGDPDESFGTINYATGELKVDFAKFPDWFAMEGDISQSTTGNGWVSVYNLQKSYVRVNWQSKLLAGGRVNTYYLAEADVPGADNNSLGHVKQGLNTLIAFYDLDNDGKYTPGEPYGMVRDIDVGWNYARASIGLTDTHPSTPRYDLTKGGNAEIGAGGNNGTTGEAATDREVIYPSDATDVYTVNGGNPAEAKGRVRVRIARFAIDSMEIGLLPQKYMAVVYDRVHDLTQTGRPVITEADILNMASNAFDIDWNSAAFDPNHMTLTSVIQEMMPQNGVPAKLADGKTPVAFTNIYYTVYVGNDSIVPLTVTNANILSKAIVRKFAASRVRPTTIPGATLLEPPAPTFQWRCDDTTYTAFRIRVTGNGVNWTSGYMLLPPRDANGVYSWTPPLRIGAIVPGGTVEFKNGGTYSWEISTYNSKYKDDLWTSGGSFVANVLTNSTDYATARVAVRYYGPDEVASSGKIRVQAFKTPDFSGEPVGEGYVTSLADISSTNAIKTANATIVGLKTGSYYIRAFIDTDGNGTRSFWTSNADKHYYWESWGCYCTRDMKLGTIFTPRSITVGPGYGANEIIPVYVEDCDTDRDSLPDAWEWKQNGNLTAYGAASIDQNAGGFAMKKSLSGSIETKGALSSGLAVMAMTNLKSPRVAALLLGVNASGTDSQVNSRLNSAQSDASAEPSYVAIKSIELDRENGKVFITTETAGKENGSTVVLSDIYEFSSGSSTLTLTCNIWHRDSLESGNWTVIETRDVEINKTSTTYEFDLADDVDLESGFFKATLEK
ncbi:MAG: hypothetical protein IJG18_06870 [Kiritimatiellae bacterium]|nr:hypothetical protein [Kiritimatiellia bacterium]